MHFNGNQNKSLWWLICHDLCATPWTKGIASTGSSTVVLPHDNKDQCNIKYFFTKRTKKAMRLPVKNWAISSFEHSNGSPLSRTTASLPRSGGCPILLQIHSISPLLDSNTSTYLLPMKLLLFARALWKTHSHLGPTFNSSLMNHITELNHIKENPCFRRVFPERNITLRWKQHQT